LGQLRSLQDWYVRYQLQSVEGVSEVASVGGYVKQYQIDVHPDKLRAQRVTLPEVYEAVRKSNIDVGAKVVENNGYEFFIRGIGFVKNVRDVENIVIRQEGGTPIFVKNVATVQLGPDFRRGALDNAGRRDESIAVMYLDLDGFKAVNDTLGHLVGDQLLAEVGTRLSRCIRLGDTVARLTATRIAARVIEEFDRPFNVGGASVDVGVSIGIAFSAAGHSHPAHLLHEADVALYQAKTAGKRRYVVYSRDLTPEQEDQLLAERTTDWRDPALRSDEPNR